MLGHTERPVLRGFGAPIGHESNVVTPPRKPVACGEQKAYLQSERHLTAAPGRPMTRVLKSMLLPTAGYTSGFAKVRS